MLVGAIKKIAMNHQVLGMNRAIAMVESLGERQVRLGVFGHTHGSVWEGVGHKRIAPGQEPTRAGGVVVQLGDVVVSNK